ncbi:MAG: PhoX family phosphatase [Candidatus Methylomirabilales bacterium]
MRATWRDPFELDEPAEPRNQSGNATFASVVEARLSRRALLKGAMGLAVLSAGMPSGARLFAATADFAPVAPTTADALILPPGYEHTILLRWGDALTPDGPAFDPTAQAAGKQALQFGYDCDFVAFFPLPLGSNSSSHGILAVNHENARSVLMFPRWDGKVASKSREMVDVEMQAHGMTFVQVARDHTGAWAVIRDSPHNRRITAATPMALGGPAAGHPLMRTSADPDARRALGTLNNCAGGVTPWGTVLTGEENIHNYFTGKAEEMADPALQALHKRYGIGTGRYGWGAYHARFDMRQEPHEANRFGWIVELDPYDLKAVPVKRTAMGRFIHEGAATILSPGGHAVAYMGDDARFEYLYKFVSAGRFNPKDRAANRNLLDAGTLYAARFKDDGTGEWLPLVYGQGPLTEANGFRSQGEVVIAARRAADVVGATKMDRPEDVEANPATGKVYCVLTSNDRRTPDRVDRANPRANNKYGHILELVEDGGDHAGTRFRWEIFILAGDPKQPAHQAFYQGRTDVSPFAGPDNLAFDTAGRMWVATDGMDDTLEANDGVWVVDPDGPFRGRARQFLSAPTGAEVCGPAFTPDNRTLFVAIQHPGMTDKATYERPGSRWPDYRADMPPRPGVVAVFREDGGKIGG